VYYYPPALHTIEICLNLDPDPDSGTLDPDRDPEFRIATKIQSISSWVTSHTSKNFVEIRS